jgi:hypothetical protein
MFLDIIHRPLYISKHNVSETGFCLRLQVKPTQLSPIDTASPYLSRSSSGRGPIEEAVPKIFRRDKEKLRNISIKGPRVQARLELLTSRMQVRIVSA